MGENVIPHFLEIPIPTDGIALNKKSIITVQCVNYNIYVPWI